MYLANKHDSDSDIVSALSLSLCACVRACVCVCVLGYTQQQHLPFSVYRCEISSVVALVSSHVVVVVDLYELGHVSL